MPIKVPYPWAPYGEAFWGGYWTYPVTVTSGVSDLIGHVRFTAQTLGYSTIELSWDEPAENYSDLVIVRSSYGYPVAPTDGLIIVAAFNPNILTPGNAVPNPPADVIASMDGLFTDRRYQDGPLEGDRFYYYSLFIRVISATPQWLRVGQCVGLVPEDNESGAWLFGLLPEWYQESDLGTPGHPTEPAMASWGQLRRYLEILGEDQDVTRTYIKSILNIFRPRFVHADLLPYLSSMFGFNFEPHIGYQQLRRVMANWFTILETKGTEGGVQLFAESLTGYNATSASGANLLLTTDDSEANESIGRWAFDTSGRRATSGSATISRVTLSVPPVAGVLYGISVTADSTPHVPSLVDGDVTSTTGVMATGVPVTEGVSYTYSFEMRATTAITPTPTPHIDWFDATGTYLSSSNGSGSAISNAAWTAEFVTATAPSTAVYAIPGYSISVVAAAPVHFTMNSFSGPGGVISYEPAREVKLTLGPPRVNWFPNPSFEGTTSTYFNASDTGYTTARSSADARVGAHSLLLSVTAAHVNVRSALLGDVGAGAAVALPTFHPGDHWTFSGLLKAAQTDSGQIGKFGLRLRGTDPVNAIRVAYSDDAVLDGSGWSFLSVSTEILQSDLDAGFFALRLVIDIDGATSGFNYYLDGFLLELNGLGAQLSYFDGYSDLSTQDFAWYGEANNSYSLYYPNRYVRNKRLVQMLPDFVPVNCPVAVTYALTDIAGYSEL